MQNTLSRDETAEVILTLTRQVLAAPDVSSAVRPLLEAFVQRTAADGGAFFQVDGSVFHARAAQGDMPTGPAMESILTHGLPGDTPLLRALTTSDAPIIVDDTSQSPETAGFPALGVASLAAVPVLDRQGTLLGAFLAHTFAPHAWTESESTFVAATTGTITGLTARLLAEEAAVAARDGALRALGMALDERDRETKGHTDRVTALALRLGRSLGLDERTLTALRWGAYLHDIGKVCIPDTVLRKPDQLDETEWRLIRTHPVLGQSFCAQLPFLPDDSLAVIRHHHEQWDGNGYPDGLAGEAIPFVARLFAVCDVYDALTSERWYKQAWTHGGALAELSSQAGRKFDPAIVVAFIELAPAPFPNGRTVAGRHLT